MEIKKPSMPKNLQIEITSCCNLKCKMCPTITDRVLSSESPGPMPERVWKNILPFARKVGMACLNVYGEPLTHPDFIPRIKELDSLGIISTFSTNGILLSEKIASELGTLRFLSNVNVSIDSPDPEVYKKIRGASLERALAGVKNLRAHTDKISVSSLLMKSTIATLPEFPAVLSRLRVKKWVLQPLKTKSETLDEEHLYYAPHVEETLSWIILAAKRENIELTLLQKDRTELEITDSNQANHSFCEAKRLCEGVTRNCIMAWAWPTVNKDGLVFPCCYISDDPEAVMGNVNEESLEDIWFGERYERFRKTITLSVCNRMPSCCNSCTHVPLVKRHMALPNRFGISTALLGFTMKQYIRWMYWNLNCRVGLLHL